MPVTKRSPVWNNKKSLSHAELRRKRRRLIQKGPVPIADKELIHAATLQAMALVLANYSEMKHLEIIILLTSDKQWMTPSIWSNNHSRTKTNSLEWSSQSLSSPNSHVYQRMVQQGVPSYGCDGTNFRSWWPVWEKKEGMESIAATRTAYRYSRPRVSGAHIVAARQETTVSTDYYQKPLFW